MNKKGWMLASFALALVFIFASFAFAANDTANTDNVAKAYKCLEDQTNGKTLSLKEATFSILALGTNGNLVDQVEAVRDSNSCWPKGACTIKETAQVALAYDRIGKDTSAIKKWILSKNGTATELKWLLEIDITNKLSANCTINDGTKENKIRILENSKIQGNPGSCFSIDVGGYMLKINANCLDKEFEILCDQDFVSSVLYQKTSGGTLFILPDTNSAASLGKTKESVNGKCFKINNICDYEGSLWAAFALQKMDEDISSFAPYLLSLADDNGRFFPSSFLYMIVGGEDQYNEIVQNQKQGKFWEMAGTRDGRFYDTSLAMLALSSAGATEVDSAKEYLLGIQTKDGCWNNNNIRDSAFLLYAGWPKAAGSFGNINSPALCAAPFACENIFDCKNAGGIVEYDYECSTASAVCCSVDVPTQSCAQKQGILCQSGTEECSGGRVESSSDDGLCCIGGTCAAIQTLATDTCTAAGGSCRSVCGSSESESSDSCSLSDEICCTSSGGSSLWFGIIFLLILIALVILGIIYRSKVGLWWFRFREMIASKFGKKSSMVQGSQAQPQRQGSQFSPMGRPMIPQRQMMPQPRVQMRAPSKDREMEEALRKLREMSKK